MIQKIYQITQLALTGSKSITETLEKCASRIPKFMQWLEKQKIEFIKT